MTRLTEGGGYFCPPQNSGTIGPIYKLQTAFDRSGKICRGKHNIIDLGITDDVTGQVKAKSFDNLACLVLSRTTAVKMEISQYNYMGRVWDTFKYDPKHSVSIFLSMSLKVNVIQGHEVKERSN